MLLIPQYKECGMSYPSAVQTKNAFYMTELIHNIQKTESTFGKFHTDIHSKMTTLYEMTNNEKQLKKQTNRVTFHFICFLF